MVRMCEQRVLDSHDGHIGCTASKAVSGSHCMGLVSLKMPLVFSMGTGTKALSQPQQ